MMWKLLPPFTRPTKSPLIRKCSAVRAYDMPEKYRESFNLANASALDNVNWYIHRAVEICNKELAKMARATRPTTLPQETVQSIVTYMTPCQKVVEMSIPVKREQGEHAIVKGYHARHGFGKIPHLGALSLVNYGEKDDVEASAIMNTHRQFGFDIPYGGSDATLILATLNYNRNERRRLLDCLSKRYFNKNVSDGEIDGIEPGTKCSADDISSITDSTAIGKKPAMIALGTDKENGGMGNHGASLLQGVFQSIGFFLENPRIREKYKTDGNIKDKTFVIQGFGNVGMMLIESLKAMGAKCIGIQEIDCSITDPKGIDVEEILNYRKRQGYLYKYPKVKLTTKLDAASAKCDFLFLTSGSRCIGYQHAPKINANVVVEVSNGTITPAAHKQLHLRGSLVLPDIFVNCGSTVASYYEYTKLTNAEKFDELLKSAQGDQRASRFGGLFSKATVKSQTDSDALSSLLEQYVVRIGSELLNINDVHQLEYDLKMAAYVNSVQKIFDYLCKTDI